MPPTDVNAANRRLAGAECFTIAPSKYLGHYVAGNLAARHNIHVHLDNSPGNGITATIDIPPTLLTTDDRRWRTESPRPTAARCSDHGHRAVAGHAPRAGARPGAAPVAGVGGRLGRTAGSGRRRPTPRRRRSRRRPAEVSRTQSGLVKRSPAHGLGTTGEPTTPRATCSTR